MIKKIYALMLILLFAVACNKSEPYIPTVEDSSSNEISFGFSDIWTKGTDIGEFANVKELEVYSYWIENGTPWGDVSEAGIIKNFFTSNINTSFTLDLDGSGNGSYINETGGVLYWPNGSSTLSFMTYYPINQTQFTQTANSTTGKPEFYYAQSEFAGDNNDIIFDAQLNQTAKSNNGKVAFDLEHILSKLTIKASLTGTCTDDANYKSVTYEVNGITIYNLKGNASLNINSDGSTSWVFDDTKDNITLTATQGVTLLDISDDADDSAVLDGDSKSVMLDGQAIFVLPQDLEDSRTEGDAPTIEVRIRKTFVSEVEGEDIKTEVVYQSAKIEIPAAIDPDTGDKESGWKAGTHYVLSYVFDIAKLSEYDTPLTLTSAIYRWSEATVDVDVLPNTYIYANTNYFEVAQGEDYNYADMIFYTNYEYDLRRHKRKYELDGTSYTEAAGFTYYRITDLATWSDSGVALDPVLLLNDDFDGTNFSTSSDYDYTTLKKYPYNYRDGVLYAGDEEVPLNTDGYMEPAQFQDADGWMYFAIEPVPDNTSYDFYYKVKKSDRKTAGLYTNSAIETDNAYGINKGSDDAVYILRLNINPSHLLKEDGSDYAVSGVDESGYFYGKIGAELLSNAGGLVNTKFKVTLKKTL